MTDNNLMDPNEDNFKVSIDLDSINEDINPKSNLFKDFCRYYTEKEERSPFNPGWEEKHEILKKIVQQKCN